MFTNLYAKPEGKMGPIKRIKWWFRRRAYIRQRGKQGFSNYDLWDFDAYLADVIGNGLKKFADEVHSYPWEETPDTWGKKVREISEYFLAYNEEIENPYQEQFDNAKTRIKNEDGSISVEIPEEIRQAYWDAETELYNAKMAKLKRGFDMLYEVFPNLWD